MMMLWEDHTFRMVVLGSLTLGLTAGSLGSFAVLRRQSLLGDAIAHATLPGVCLAFMLTQSKFPLVLLLGAAISGWIGTLVVKTVTENTVIKKDTALGIVLSVFFGLGLVLLTLIQKFPSAKKAGLDNFLFGNAATLLKEDVVTMMVLSVLIMVALLLMWKEFKLVVFDAGYARSQGLAVHTIDVILTILIVMTIVLGLQTVGVVLISALLVAPAAAARQWTDRLGVMVLLSASFGAIAGVGGSVVSSVIPNLPTGPTIVVFVSVLVLVSLTLSPHRGLLWDALRSYRHRKQIRKTTMLKNLMLFSEISTNPFHPHDISALQAIGRGAVQQTMLELSKDGLVQSAGDQKWALTPQGLRVAKKLLKEYESVSHG